MRSSVIRPRCSSVTATLFNRFAASREDVECMSAEHGITAFPALGRG